jgi:hypothetical protein
VLLCSLFSLCFLFGFHLISPEVSFHPISPEEHEVIKPQAEKSFYNPTEKFFFFFSQICKTTTTCEASHHHHPQETYPTGHAAKQRPAHWPNHEGETHPAGHAKKHESIIAVVKPATKPCRSDPNGLKVVESC